VSICQEKRYEIFKSELLKMEIVVFQVHVPKVKLASFPDLHAQLLSLAVRKAGGRPGRICHVMRATDGPTPTILLL